MKNTGQENRRKHPRISTDIEIKIENILKRGDKGLKLGKVKNMSCSGMFCSVNNFVNLLTKMEGVLKLTINKSEEEVTFRGIVVRCDPQKKVKECKDYNIAIFFNSMEDEDKEKIKHYLETKSHK